MVMPIVINTSKNMLTKTPLQNKHIKKTLLKAAPVKKTKHNFCAITCRSVEFAVKRFAVIILVKHNIIH